MIEFELKRSHNGKKSRWAKKYPRKRIERIGGGRKAIKVVNWYNKNWIDDNFSYFPQVKVIKFMKANIGRPVDKVFSEFLERCDKSTKSYNLRREFYAHIEKKEDINPSLGGFYITNGILNYKEKIRISPSLTPSRFELLPDYAEYNYYHLPSKSKIVDICNKATDRKEPQLLGRLYVGKGIEKKMATVYIEDGNFSNLLFKDCVVAGFGRGIGIHIYSDQYRYGGHVYLFYVDKYFRTKITPMYKFVIRWRHENK